MVFYCLIAPYSLHRAGLSNLVTVLYVGFHSNPNLAPLLIISRLNGVNSNLVGG